MEVTRFLGTQRFAWLMDLGRGPGCGFQLLRRESDGARFLAQLWSPLPGDRDLDQLRDTFLARFLDADPLDPILGHFGFDDGQAWHLQALQGTPLARLWPGWGPAQRQALNQCLARELARDPHPRFLHPEAITFRPGLTQIPRVLGEAPWGLPGLSALLPADLPTPSSGDLPWTLPRDLSEPLSRPLRGRAQELPYLKSLMLGLDAPIPMERIVLLQGEEGIGKARLAAWACAVAEGEGIWTHPLEAATDEPAGPFLGRLLEALLAGREADLYAQRPEAARALSLRMQAFAFLTGGRHRNRQEAGPEPEEVKAALEALDFARLLHPRLVHLSNLERATPEVLALVRELVHRSELPWLLSLTTGAQGAGLRPLIADLRQEAAAALVGVNRLEDEDLRTILDDLLGRHALPDGYVADLVTQSLGNPGLLQNVLELAQQEGALAWEQDRWTLAGPPTALRAEADLVQQVFLGRVQRLTPAAATLVRLLALAERPLPDASLGRLLGLSGEALEDALQGASGSRLIQLQAHQASIPDPRWRELVLAHTPQAELKRLARALLAALQEQGAPVAPLVTLQALASDEATALAAVLEALDHQPPAPQEAQRMVEQALRLQPRPWDEARLHEHLADAWAAGSQAPPLEGESARPVADRALEALDRALDALGRSAFHEGVLLAEARMLRKRAMLLLQLRRPAEAQEPVMAAADRLKDHPLHPEQPRLRLALGQLHLLQGHLTKGIRALEEGLHPPGGRLQPPDQAALLTALGRALGAQGQFQRASDLLESAQRLLEHGQDFRGLVPTQIALAQVRLGQGQAGPCIALLQEALQTARMQGDLGLQCQCHLVLGAVRSLQQLLEPARTHLDRALGQAQRLGDAAQATMIQIWRARTLAAMGDPVAAEHAQFQAAGAGRPLLAPEELGDHTLIQGDVAGFRGAWRDAARLCTAAADQFEAAGLLWRHRLARLRLAQALARESQRARQEAPEQGWAILESLKGPVEGSGSRWLELEWHRAHALLLSTVPPTEAVAEEALRAWSEVLAAARDLQFPAQVVEACAESAQLLLQRGEKLGAKARLQDAFPGFQELWSRLPETQGTAFLGREDLHRFRQTVEAAGLRWVLPDRADPLQDWTPTQMNLPVVPEAED